MSGYNSLVDGFMNQRIQLYILLCGLIVSPCAASLQKPSDGQLINYIHVLFEWDQEPDAEKYQIQVSQSESFDSILFSDTTDLTLFIDQEHIDWEENYFWQCIPSAPIRAD